MEPVAAYLGLFGAALLAATIVPAQSEAVLFGLLVAGYPAPALVAVASVGNVLGSCVNWLLGRLLIGVEDRPWFPIRREGIARAEAWYRRYGRWSLLLSWVPLVGDPLTVAAGLCFGVEC